MQQTILVFFAAAAEHLVNGGRTEPVPRGCLRDVGRAEISPRCRLSATSANTVEPKVCARTDDGRAARSSQNRHIIRLWTLEFSILIGKLHLPHPHTHTPTPSLNVERERPKKKQKKKHGGEAEEAW